MNIRKTKPRARLSLGILFIFTSVVIAYLFFYYALMGLSFGLVASGGLLIYGVYIVLTLSSYKERYFPHRFSAMPISPDNSQLEDNSEQLQQQIAEERARDSLTDLKLKVVFAATLIMGIFAACLIEKAYLFMPGMCVVIIILIKYLRKYSPEVRQLANRISIYIAIYLIGLSVPMINIASKYIYRSSSLILALTIIIITEVSLVIDAIINYIQLNKERTINADEELQ